MEKLKTKPWLSVQFNQQRRDHMKQVKQCLLALVLCLPMTVSIALADSTGPDGAISPGSNEAPQEVSLTLSAEATQVTVNNVIYSLSSGEAIVVGYTKDIPSACTIPASITVNSTSYPVITIEDSAFYNCSNLVTVDLPASITAIGSEAFSGCVRLTTVQIPAGVSTIGSLAFADCSALTSFTVDAGNSVYSARDGMLFRGTVLVQYPLGRSGACTVPAGTTEIGDYAFCRAMKLQSVSLPDTVTVIGEMAFSECDALQTANVGSGLKSLGQRAFEACSRLTAIALPASMEDIDFDCFEAADALTSIQVAEGCERFFDDSGVLYGYGFPGEKTISRDTLVLYAYPAGSSRTSYTVLSGAKAILSSAFWHARTLTDVGLPDSLTEIQFGAFTGSGLTSITLPDTVTGLGENVFQTCYSLAEVSLGKGVTELAKGLFYHCDSLTVFTIPKQVTSIADDAFDSCANLEAYVVEEGSETYSSYDGVLYNADQTELLVCPATRRTPELELPASVTAVSYGAFVDCKYLQRITVAEGNTVYYDVDGVLFERTGAQSVKDLSQSTNVYVTVDFGDSLHTFPLGRTDTAYTVPDGVWTISERAFSRNTTLTEIDLNEVRYVRYNAFFFCTNLSRVTGTKLVGLVKNAFFRNDSLVSLTLPDTVAYLGQQCLDYCYSLEYIEFLRETPPATRGTSNSTVCFGASGLRYVYVPAGTSVTYKSALSGKLYPGAMIVEGRYVPEAALSEQIESLTPQSSAAEVNAAAAGVVRLLSGETRQLSDEQLIKVDELFQAAHEDLTVDVSSTSNNVTVQGAAVASGLVEHQAEDGTVSGTVAVQAEEQPTEVGELLDLAFTMTVDGQETELQAPVVVTVTLPESMQGQDFLLVHRDDAGTETPVNYTQDGDTVTFRAFSFSSYVFLAPGVSYAASQDSTLLLATYDQAGRMVSIRTMPVAAGTSATLPFQTPEGFRCRAFLLDSGWAPTGSTVIR